MYLGVFDDKCLDILSRGVLSSVGPLRRQRIIYVEMPPATEALLQIATVTCSSTVTSRFAVSFRILYRPPHGLMFPR